MDAQEIYVAVFVLAENDEGRKSIAKK
jgi:hypothetical protein